MLFSGFTAKTKRLDSFAKGEGEEQECGRTRGVVFGDMRSERAAATDKAEQPEKNQEGTTTRNSKKESGISSPKTGGPQPRLSQPHCRVRRVPSPGHHPPGPTRNDCPRLSLKRRTMSQ